MTGQLGAAEDLLAATRIAVVDGESYRYDGLAGELAATADALQLLESDLDHPPR